MQVENDLQNIEFCFYFQRSNFFGTGIELYQSNRYSNFYDHHHQINNTQNKRIMCQQHNYSTLSDTFDLFDVATV